MTLVTQHILIVDVSQPYIDIEELPVELTYFNSTCNSVTNNVLIVWETLTETNNDYFEIQKSYDLIGWEYIGIVYGVGNSNILNHYEYDYNEPTLDIIYLRLKQVDYDGQLNITILLKLIVTLL